MKIGIYYFSGTGNTKYGCEMIKKRMISQGHLCEIFSVESNTIFSYDGYDLIGFASPVYHGYPAQILMDFIKKIPIFGKTVYAFTIICPCFLNFGYWGSREHLNDLLESKNFQIIGELGFYGEASHPFIRSTFMCKELIWISGLLLAKGRPNYRDEKQINRFVDNLPVLIENFKNAKKPKLHNSRFNRWLSFRIIRPLVESKNQNMLKKRVNKELCTKCGICQKNCPVSAIKMDEYPVFTETCFNCQRCINQCPRNSIFYQSAKNLNQYKGLKYQKEKAIEKTK